VNWLHPKLAIRNRKTGFGVYATSELERGTVVAGFGGSIIPVKQFEDIVEEQARSFPYHVDDEFLLGPTTFAEVDKSDMWNHSCNPNVGFLNQLFLICIRDIESGEELLIRQLNSSLCRIADVFSFK
jgi:hypothetical protein